MARAIASRWVATAPATSASSALIMSTISAGLARSIATVRGLRRSVTRGSSAVDDIGSCDRRVTSAPVARRGATLTYPARGTNRNEFRSLLVHRPLAVAAALLLAAPLADAQVLPVPRRSSAPVA